MAVYITWIPHGGKASRDSVKMKQQATTRKEIFPERPLIYRESKLLEHEGCVQNAQPEEYADAEAHDSYAVFV
jgi:hypothetical protein